MKDWRLRWLIFALATLLIGGCGPNAQEQHTVTDLTQTMLTRCVGRYLIDLPKDFRLNDDLASSPGNLTLTYGKDENFTKIGVSVLEQHVTPEQFAVSVKKRSAEIAAETNNKSKTSMLVLDKNLGEGKELLRYYDNFDSDNYHKHELHLLVGDSHIMLKADSYEGVIEPVEAHLQKLATQVRAFTDPAKAGPGFCLGNVVIDSDNDYEDASFSYSQVDLKHRDVLLEFYFSTFKQDAEEPGLIKRGQRADTVLGGNRKKFRSGEISVAGMPAEELLERAEIATGFFQHQFFLETQPAVPSFMQAATSIEFQDGGQNNASAYVAPSYTDHEALGLWDAVVKTLRPRPGAAAR